MYKAIRNSTMKATLWGYLIFYSFFSVMIVLTPFLLDDFSIVVIAQSLILLCPAYAMYQHLKRKAAHPILSIAGLIPLSLVLIDAPKFSEIPGVTLVMYAFSLPMLGFVVFHMYVFTKRGT